MCNYFKKSEKINFPELCTNVAICMKVWKSSHATIFAYDSQDNGRPHPEKMNNNLRPVKNPQALFAIMSFLLKILNPQYRREDYVKGPSIYFFFPPFSVAHSFSFSSSFFREYKSLSVLFLCAPLRNSCHS